MTRIELRPIGPEDVARTAQFLHAHMNAEISAQAWSHAIAPPWRAQGPNAGFLLLDGAEIAGAYLALYRDREIDGRTVPICNLGTWCVREEHRLHSLRLLRALLRQRDYDFTDLSPAPEVVRLNVKLGFRDVDTTASLVPNLPWPSRGRGRVSSDPAVIERTLTGEDLRRYRDHAAAPAVRHVVLRAGGECCWIMLRRERRKGLALFANLLHVSNPRLLHRLARPFARHLLLRHRTLAHLAEDRVVGGRLPLSVRFASSTRRMYRSRTLEPQQIDYLYSELVCLPA